MDFDCENNNGENDKIRLTIDELRKFEGFDAISDSEAESIIDSLFRLGIIGFNLIG